MNIQITRTRAEDVPAVVRLLREFAEFEELSEFCQITEDRLFDAMFGGEAFVEGLMAFDDDKAVGYAIFYPYFASFRGQRGLYLEDIYIDSKYRGKGVGEAMVKEIARLAALRGFERIDFQVLEWNTPAIKFYEKLGAVHEDEERHFKFTGEAFKKLATDRSEPPA